MEWIHYQTGKSETAAIYVVRHVFTRLYLNYVATMGTLCVGVIEIHDIMCICMYVCAYAGT